MRTASPYLVVLVLICGCSLPAIDPEPEDETVERHYSKSISRTFSSTFEEDLVRKAELTYPLRDSVLAAADPRVREHIPAEGYWWFTVFDFVPVPYAITLDAINYYSGLIDAVESGETHQFIVTAKMEYSADASFHSSYEILDQEFKAVHVVSMNLRWRQYCGMECAMSFDVKRVVIFDSNGEIVRVFFDQRNPFIVS